jgi:hypothetical protein
METISMAAAKANLKAGLRFLSPTGAIGTILEAKSPHGKWQAELTCTFKDEKSGEECTNVHVREQSDWHQCSRCGTHQRKGKSTVTTNVSLKALAEQNPELAQLLEQEAQVKASIKAAKDAQKAEKKVVSAAERETVKARARLERALALAKEIGLPVSQRTLDEAQSAEA